MLKLLKLGDLSKKYEVGNGGPGFVSSGKGDPGGISYGVYQLASKTGTLKKYLEASNYYNDELRGLEINSKPFINKWKEIGERDGPNFEHSQWEFIKRTHFNPVRDYADKLNVIKNPAVDQVLWSIGVQHGKANKIVHDAGISGDLDPKSVIRKLYKTRVQYVKGLSSTKQVINGLLNRYANEEKDALTLSEQV